MVVSLTFASWNQMASWLSQLQGLQGAASSSGQEFTNHFQLSGRRILARHSPLSDDSGGIARPARGDRLEVEASDGALLKHVGRGVPLDDTRYWIV